VSKSSAIRTISAVLACLAPAPTLSAQEPVRLSGEVTCSQCVITLDTVLTLGGLGGPGLHVITDESRVAVDPGGRILVTNLKEAEISVFDSAGTFLQTVGGRGEGPGEYTFISRINAGPRYIHVFEYHHGRTLLDHGFNVVAEHPLPGWVWDAFVTESDDAVFAGRLPTPGSVGLDLHVFSPSGDITSYGDDHLVRPQALDDVLYVAGNGQTLWVLPETRNRLVRWDLGSSPRVGSVFDRVVEPFERHNPPHFSLPRSFNVGAMLNDDGLWVAWIAPDPEWTDRRVTLGGIPPDVPPSREYDGWIDLIDPTTGRSLARHRSDKTSLGFAKGHGYLIMYEETEAGVPYIHLVEPRLTRDVRGASP